MLELLDRLEDIILDILNYGLSDTIWKEIKPWFKQARKMTRNWIRDNVGEVDSGTARILGYALATITILRLYITMEGD